MASPQQSRGGLAGWFPVADGRFFGAGLNLRCSHAAEGSEHPLKSMEGERAPPSLKIRLGHRSMHTDTHREYLQVPKGLIFKGVWVPNSL